MIFFHVTPLENLESILENGLQVGVKTTSDQYEPLGVYLSSNWIELLASKTFMEIFRYEQLAILSVQVSMDGLLQDPEYNNCSFIKNAKLNLGPNYEPGTLVER